MSGPGHEDWSIVQMALTAVSGSTAEDKIEFAANVLGIAGFVMSLPLMSVSILYRRGTRGVATLGDFKALGATVACMISDDLVDRLTRTEMIRMAELPGYTDEQRIASARQLQASLSRVLDILGEDESDAAKAAAANLLLDETHLAEKYFSERAERALTSDVQLSLAIESLQLKAALEHLRDLAQALQSCGRAVALDETDEHGWRRLGYLLLRLGRIDEARRAFAKACPAQGSPMPDDRS